MFSPQSKSGNSERTGRELIPEYEEPCSAIPPYSKPTPASRARSRNVTKSSAQAISSKNCQASSTTKSDNRKSLLVMDPVSGPFISRPTELARLKKRIQTDDSRLQEQHEAVLTVGKAETPCPESTWLRQQSEGTVQEQEIPKLVENTHPSLGLSSRTDQKNALNQAPIPPVYHYQRVEKMVIGPDVAGKGDINILNRPAPTKSTDSWGEFGQGPNQPSMAKPTEERQHSPSPRRLIRRKVSTQSTTSANDSMTSRSREQGRVSLSFFTPYEDLERVNLTVKEAEPIPLRQSGGLNSLRAFFSSFGIHNSEEKALTTNQKMSQESVEAPTVAVGSEQSPMKAPVSSSPLQIDAFEQAFHSHTSMDWAHRT